jgi:hypothetical protein
MTNQDTVQTEQLDRLCRVLVCCRGAQHARTLDQLTVDAGIPNRRATEQLIEEHLDSFPWPLVAGSTGYYIPTDADDLNRYLHNLHSRHRRMQQREHTVRRKAMAFGWIEECGRFINPATCQQQELFG